KRAESSPCECAERRQQVSATPGGAERAVPHSRRGLPLACDRHRDQRVVETEGRSLLERLATKGSLREPHAELAVGAEARLVVSKSREQQVAAFAARELLRFDTRKQLSHGRVELGLEPRDVHGLRLEQLAQISPPRPEPLGGCGEYV